MRLLLSSIHSGLFLSFWLGLCSTLFTVDGRKQFPEASLKGAGNQSPFKDDPILLNGSGRETGKLIRPSSSLSALDYAFKMVFSKEDLLLSKRTFPYGVLLLLLLFFLLVTRYPSSLILCQSCRVLIRKGPSESCLGWDRFSYEHKLT